tara:strand:+ start:357 stop:536 length:180 start_codon:yes stop_codon:yes gene_type:complete
VDKEIKALWDYLIETQLVTADEVRLVTAINGTNLESFEDMLYVRTGYRDLEQILEAEAE